MPKIAIQNQKPVVLSPNYLASPVKSFDVRDDFERYFASAFFEPLNTTPPTFTVDNTPLTQTDLAKLIVNVCDETYDANAEDTLKAIFEQSMLYYKQTTSLLAKHVFSVQSALRANLALPTPTLLYTAQTDVIPSAKAYLSTQNDLTFDTWFASLAFYTHMDTLAVSVIDTSVFDDFKTYIRTEISNARTTLDAQVIQRFTDFDKSVNLSTLTESITVRKNYTDDNDPLSFPRLLNFYIQTYAKNRPHNFDILAFSLAELVCPKNIIFVNVDAHAHATATQVNAEWKLITSALANPLRVLSKNKITKLTAAQRVSHNAQKQIACTQNALNEPATQNQNVAFSRHQPTTLDIVARINRILTKMANVARSENSYSYVKSSFNRANRRHPDDFNLPGQTYATQYKPDLHIYLDTSGSISEENYESTIKACIKLARKLNINFYFNSFSHVISQSTHLSLKNRSVSQVYQQFAHIPKVSGGTDFTQVWGYINKSKKRRKELSIVISDMEFSTPTSTSYSHPKNLYYVPTTTDEWAWLLADAITFCKSTTHVFPQIRSHILF